MSIAEPDPIQQLIDKHRQIWAKDRNNCGKVDIEVCIEGLPQTI